MNRQSTGVADAKIERLVAAVRRRAPLDAAEVLRNESDDTIAAVMRGLHPAMALRVVLRFPEERQSRLRQLAGQGIDDTWTASREYPEGTVGRLMEPVYAVFPPDATVADAVARIRELVEVSAVTYAYVIDDAGRLARTGGHAGSAARRHR